MIHLSLCTLCTLRYTLITFRDNQTSPSSVERHGFYSFVINELDDIILMYSLSPKYDKFFQKINDSTNFKRNF